MTIDVIKFQLGQGPENLQKVRPGQCFESLTDPQIMDILSI